VVSRIKLVIFLHRAQHQHSRNAELGSNFPNFLFIDVCCTVIGMPPFEDRYEVAGHCQPRPSSDMRIESRSYSITKPLVEPVHSY